MSHLRDTLVMLIHTKKTHYRAHNRLSEVGELQRDKLQMAIVSYSVTT